ncbi:metal ABC transporter solute-binding protein, Zn/Mn family [Limisalsivibrio acetivorans]|uniref:metal ABC transporter solute-binding protein, Zn/Mn family n=1 Tax=Limisalsivibrio acetivorans TaxID=1304888 RepID=UPI0003B4C11A|nr:zinc ABC transporter substrate-binding protein [Limisalsivibrio acetivorans]
MRLIVFLSIFLLAVSAMAEVKTVVSVLPQHYIASKLSMGEVMVMVERGASPAVYEPKPKQMAYVAGADLYFPVGVPFEKAWLERIASAGKELRVVKCYEKVERRPIAAHHHEGEAHDHGGEEHGHEGEAHSHDGEILDPHIWLSPPMMIKLAECMRDAYIEEDPAMKVQYQLRYQALKNSIADTHIKVQNILTELKSREFMVFHPSWGYFADEYGLEQVAVEVDGKEPKPAELAELIRRAKEHGIDTVFVQPEFSKKSAETVAKAINGRVEVLDPLDENWSANMIRSAEKIKEALNR